MNRLTPAYYALVWLIGLGMGIGLDPEPGPLPVPSESQTREELAVCMATMVRASEALDSVETWILAQQMTPVSFDWAGRP